ncbi:pilus assembly protein CpaB [Cupriavidus metallidurans]|jgi:pilus assembly protein CpaB|uniref:Flp pilus assembly CpaB n=1 Tax=Cupriavidus metallidurans (strain ATCC 43123 / DSM 2839 / NBRC 102507 / CH34) TaxID=266264 RepID=Q1LQP2_CUPMC|nr:Flp pilus assembly protein CpaB [Cupriavidus metallidurans]ABF07534.1 Flp pilus assembly CpaB precursor [Cupriavidus metallidurans CH34]AVA32773.1 Flp pilus assembly protein CpaB [Cupriavidus metallidurans]MDE4916942.1 Flp pilus assembly protein CpaB [Cupriavidus metallidurans]QGS28147.1 Flp pilus assembly protein CpaB [Cupriavidus metallidurans]UBM11632.1 Flp pilus assembly protein CpaB [Cupriavidus metallidurans]
MKNTRAILMLLIALVAGAAAVVSASRWLLQQSSSSVKQVVVAANDLDLGQPLNGSQLKLVSWPAGSVPPGAFEDPKTLDGRVVRTSLQRGEPIIDAKLAPVGTKGGLSAVINDGKRAITVRVNDVVGVAGFALPGNYVDVIVNTNEDTKSAQNGSISKIVLEKILVLAVAQQVSRDDTQPKVVNAVTLEVSPDQAEKLDVARSVGTLSLVLRNQMDVADINTGGATKHTLLGKAELPAPAPLAAPAPVTRTVVKTRTVAAAPRAGNCVGVLAGIQGSLECF